MKNILVIDDDLHIGNAVLVQPFLRLLAGGAFGVADKSHGVTLLITKVYFLARLLQMDVKFLRSFAGIYQSVFLP